MKHTPGPWKALRGHDGDSERWIVVTDGKMNWHIAVIENGAPGDMLETEGWNAAMIAVAPDMYALIESLIHIAENGPFDPSPLDENSPLMDAAREIRRKVFESQSPTKGARDE